jgi:6,7-dimethyl-8-ribityllumazine synthase
LIKWETPHFDIIADAATQGLTKVSTEYDTPIIFGLLTCNTLEQAQARIDENYAIYWLNYVVQHLINQNILEDRMSHIQGHAEELLQEFTA